MKKASDFYGWRIVAVLALTETLSWGILYYTFSVFITAMESDLHASRTEVTGAFSLALLVMGIMAFPVGTWIDQHGARFLMTTGSILASLLLVAWSQVTDVRTLYFIWFGIGVCGACVLYEPAFAVVTAWFRVYRARALALITFAAGLASTIFVPLSTALLNAVGWRSAVLLLALLLAGVTIPLHCLVIRRRPADLGLMPDGETMRLQQTTHHPASKTLAEALRTPFFWVLTGVFALASLASAAIRVHFIPFLTTSGLDSASAALASGSIGIMQVIGRLIFAPLELRLSIRSLLLVILVTQVASIGMLILGTAPLLVGGFVITFGTSYGAITLARVTALSSEFGATHYGRISSIMTLFLTVSTTAAPVGASVLFDTFHSYTVVLWGILGLLIGASLLVLALHTSRVRSGHLAGEIQPDLETAA